MSRPSIHKLSDGLASLYAAPDLLTWAERSIALVRDYISADYYGLSICEPGCSHAVAVWEPTYVKLGDFAPIFATIQHHHPLYTGWNRVGSKEKVMRLSETMENSALQENPVVREVFRPLRFKNQMGVWSMLGTGRHLEIGCNRTGSDFNRRDTLHLALLRPHITQSYLNWCRTAELRGMPAAPIMLLQQTRMSASRMQLADAATALLVAPPARAISPPR